MDGAIGVLTDALRATGEEELSRAPLIYDGKAKRVRQCPGEHDLVLMEFKNSFTAFDAVKRDEKAGKGRLNCAISSFLMNELRQTGDLIPQTLIAQVSPVHQLVQRVEIIPIEVIVRNEAHGSLCKRYGITAGQKLSEPLTEIGLKDDALHDPFFTSDEIPVDIMELLTWSEMKQVRALADITNDSLYGIFAEHSIRLLDFKLEFGRLADGSIVLADEITGDTCRLVDAETLEKLDKDNFRFDLGDVMKGYAGLAQRLGLDPEAILQGRWR
ncbi:phosphoribosylaminoimidazolesuccinocarboxamide synthase [candidate division Kazan bacterium RIFCSPHIGHO2_01_FULL_49_10]|uniref:Phosphoribosylaminoimidazole-succinocarboxamide synthase n=1 Tax=candidate division Kazan bacterium RIFCSPLOWO2_01_FULL_48_13 TaxID=1798539 RepID=A0A1F4PPL6_UNCK3|nr:MAG: phosphoribosylaminoimidazolesuccinocarboxamide synthase [candidate division Kazan bacterium RIFCSPHIGHO2_01_FULL_49_10]OGB85565.1 MAG: phosphoribosylaminoimidazolesuccinocarboxamide synthase [candidate division Kazan bacterium RIFCSPLOWO2_01_FULL_48_13]